MVLLLAVPWIPACVPGAGEGFQRQFFVSPNHFKSSAGCGIWPPL